MKAFATAALTVGLLGPAMAGPITGDAVDISLHQGIDASIVPGGGCRTLSAVGRVIGAGIELTNADLVSGGCSGGFSVDIDGNAKTITLGSTGGAGDYRWATLEIFGFDIEDITGVSLLSNGLFTLAGTGTVIPVPTLAFTSTSISISFDPPGSAVFDITPETGAPTVFQFTTRASSSVPEPSTLLLVAASVVGLMARRRRR